MSDNEREEKPFAVERAKTGRAKCKKCKCPIEKDAVRIAKLLANPFGDGKMKAWHHLTCLFEVFAKQRAATKRIDDPEQDIDGWADLCGEDKTAILQKIEEFENSAPFKAPKGKGKDSSPKKRKVTPSKEADIPGNKTKRMKKEDSESSSEDASPSQSSSKKREKKHLASRDDSFREFQQLCTDVANADAYTEKTAIVKRMLTKGSEGGGFKSDLKLWCRLLLPGAVKRVYNLQSKQLVKLFSRLLLQDEDEMLEDLEKGDVAETIRVFFEKSVAKPARHSTLTVQEVDQFLEKLSLLTREDEQVHHFRSIIPRCTANDLRMIIRLIKHDLRINAGPKHILGGVHEDAYQAFQTSRDLNSVIDRCLQGSSVPKLGEPSSSGSPSNKVALTLMTPVLPMLAEACKSVEMAMKKCPYGMLSEVKYDGERVQVHKRGSEFKYFSRSLKPVLPHKVNLFKDYIPEAFPDGDDLILDAEVLMIDTKTGQPLPFGSLGIHKKSEFKDANACLFVFDCIYYNGEVLLNKTTVERRRILTERMTEIPNRILLSEVQKVNNPKDLAEMIAKVLKMGLEGLVLKDVNSKYEPGKRHWLKVKKDYLFGGAMADTADLVVLGAWYGTGNKGGMMSVFLMGCYNEEQRQWVTVTKVHTGHDDATLTMLQDELDMVKISKDPAKVPPWLLANKPMIPDFVARDPKKQPVWEITGAELTNQGVHTADGISIRFPRVTRIRSDKDWSTATTLHELRALFKRSSESIDLSLLLPSKFEAKEETEIKKEPEELGKEEEKFDGKSKSPKKSIDLNLLLPFKFEAKAETEIKKEPEELGKEEEKFDRKSKSPKKSIDLNLLLPSKFEAKAETEIKKEPEEVAKEEEKFDRKSKSPKESKRSPKRSPRMLSPKKSRSEQAKPVVDRKIKTEPNDRLGSSEQTEERAEFYAFVKKDYIEYTADGTPLNWVEGRKPRHGLPADAKSLSDFRASELSKTILEGTPVLLAPGFEEREWKHAASLLKTLGARTLTERQRSMAAYVVHPYSTILSSKVRDFEDVPKTARHVAVSWLEASASAAEIQQPGSHAVELAADYCSCPCRHR